MSRALRVAVLGAGTVGREVVRALVERGDELTAADGVPLELAGVAVRDLHRARARGLSAALLSDAPAHLVADPEIDIIVELMGGDEPAHTLIAAALAAGKAVVTANKHVIAHHGAGLEATARRTGAALRFEAAVGGGHPRPRAARRRSLPQTGSRRYAGSSTGRRTTSSARWIRRAGSTTRCSPPPRLPATPRSDPSGDVEGHDAANKLVILARLAFGVWLDPADVVRRAPGAPGHACPGITGVTSSDMAAARSAGEVVKLIARAERASDRVVASVLATRVAQDSALGRTDGVLNRIEIEAEPVGTVAFSGPGAGGPATSSAVLGDLMAIGRELGSTWAGLPPAGAA